MEQRLAGGPRPGSIRRLSFAQRRIGLRGRGTAVDTAALQLWLPRLAARLPATVCLEVIFGGGREGVWTGMALGAAGRAPAGLRRDLRIVRQELETLAVGAGLTLADLGPGLPAAPGPLMPIVPRNVAAMPVASRPRPRWLERPVVQ